MMAKMMDRESAEYWATRLDSAHLPGEDQAEFEKWLAGDERRDGALLRAQATLAYLDRGRALPHAVPVTMYSRTRRGFLLYGAGAVAAALGAGLYMILPRDRQIITQIGEVRQVPLSDGSTATVNTASQVAVHFEKTDRIVRLTEGEAWFRVAHDTSRPFIVEAGDVRVRAVGTAFSVRRRNASADVLVTEGTVDTWIVGKESQAVRISAGSKAFVSRDAGEISTTSASGEIDRTLAWRTGELALDGESLAYAVEEINRYNTVKLVVDSPDLAHEPLVGYFRTNEPANFSHAVAGLIGARVTEDGNTIHIGKTNL